MRMVTALSPTVLQHGLGAMPECGNGVVDRGAALFLRHHAVAFLFLSALIGDVLVGRNPAAARHRSIGDGNCPPVGELRQLDFEPFLVTLLASGSP